MREPPLKKPSDSESRRKCFKRKIKNRPLPTEEEKTGDVVDDLAPAADTLKYTLQA